MKEATKGGVSEKVINGKTYFYYQWYENGKRRSRTVSEDEAKQIQDNLSLPLPYQAGEHPYPGIHVFTGEALRLVLQSVEGMRKRFCFDNMMDYLTATPRGKVFVLYGLRRTGKTTLMLQAIESLGDLPSCAFVTCAKGATLVNLNHVLRELVEAGVKHIFLDEVTIIEDFVDGSAFLADAYARMAHVVLAGTDSLGFFLAGRDELYDRMILEHTTYIPFKEFAEVLGLMDIDQYIEYGGTFVHEGVNYHKGNELEYQAYTDSAIVHNIQHSLWNYQDGSMLSRFKHPYEEEDITNLINRVIQDQNHRFVQNVLNRRFVSRDYGSLKELILKQTDHPELIAFIEKVDEESLYHQVSEALDIVAVPCEWEKDDMEEMKRYLKAIDVLDEVDIVNMENGQATPMVLFSQPAMRYAQCRELIEALFQQKSFYDLSAAESSFLIRLLTNDVKGRMLEEIALLDAKHRGLRCFKASFLSGEYDMVLYDEETNKSSIFEIKHSDKTHDAQRRFLLDPALTEIYEKRFGPIAKRVVLYRGEDMEVGEVSYRNIAKFLCR